MVVTGTQANTGEFLFQETYDIQTQFFCQKIRDKNGQKNMVLFDDLYRGGGFFKSPVNTMGEGGGGGGFLWILLLKEYRLLT